jgi:hypothetical protein
MADRAELHFPYKKLEAMLKGLGERATRQQLGKAMAQTGDLYEAEAVKLAPHLTGYLENSSTVRTRATGQGVQTEVAFTANYAAEVHELPPAARGKKTQAKPATKFGAPGPKFLERVLRGMDFEHFIGEAVRELLRKAAGRGHGRR